MSASNRRKGLSASVHRFRDCVAIHVGTGETSYLTPKQARKLAHSLYKACRDIDRRPFTESDLDTVCIKIN